MIVLIDDIRKLVFSPSYLGSGLHGKLVKLFQDAEGAASVAPADPDAPSESKPRKKKARKED